MSRIIGILFVVGIVLVAGLSLSIIRNDDDVRRFSSYDELVSFLKTHQESYSGEFYSIAALRTMETTAVPAAAESKIAAYSTTNIQVAGVDEADIVKNDGKYIYVVSGNKVFIVDAYPAESAGILSKIEINGTIHEIFINKDRLVVFGQEFTYPTIVEQEVTKRLVKPTSYYSSKTFIKVYDVSDGNNPVMARNAAVDGYYFDSRMIGDYVYMVSTQPIFYAQDEVQLPVIVSEGKERQIAPTDIHYFDVIDGSYTFTNIIALNTQTDEELTEKVFLLGYTNTLFVSKDNIYVTYMKRMSQYQVMEKILDAITNEFPPDIRVEMQKIRSSSSNSYEKLQAIGRVLENYLESIGPEKSAEVMRNLQEKSAKIQADIARETEKTIVHKISIDKSSIEYKTKGEVPGYPLNQFSMDEHNGYFRIATTTRSSGFNNVGIATRVSESSTTSVESTVSSERVEEPAEQLVKPSTPPVIVERPVVIERPTSFNNLYILDGSLKIVGKVEDLAPGERIYSVRFVGDRGYMVTFRQIDPLFVIDLKDPTNPKVLGYLKISGVSDYLHPYDENHVIGVGRDATDEGRIQGMKLSLFDVSDVSNPKEVSKFIIGKSGTYSEVLNDHKAFLFNREKNLLVMPVRVAENGNWNAFEGAYVFNVDLDNGFVLKGKISHTKEVEEKDYYDYMTQIRRSLFVDDVLYTISNRLIKMNSLTDLSEINLIDFN